MQKVYLLDVDQCDLIADVGWIESGIATSAPSTGSIQGRHQSSRKDFVGIRRGTGTHSCKSTKHGQSQGGCIAIGQVESTTAVKENRRWVDHCICVGCF